MGGGNGGSAPEAADDEGAFLLRAANTENEHANEKKRMRGTQEDRFSGTNVKTDLGDVPSPDPRCSRDN
jgi:hypothetical protein